MSDAIGLTPQYGLSSGNRPFKTQFQYVPISDRINITTPENTFASLVCVNAGNSTFPNVVSTFIIPMDSSSEINVFLGSGNTGYIQASLTETSLLITFSMYFGIQYGAYGITWLISF